MGYKCNSNPIGRFLTDSSLIFNTSCLFHSKIRLSQNLLSAAFVIGALRVQMFKACGMDFMQ